MNIKELETLTGVTKQNIRFYEKKGLLSPERNPENDYREYSDEDIQKLKAIKMFRKLDFSIEDIRLVLEGELELDSVVENHLHKLTAQETQLKTSIELCRQLLNKKLETLDVTEILEKMEVSEKQGGVFMNIMNDYKQVAESEGRKEFSFVPDTMTLTPQEFSEALFKFADDNKMNLVITKESMYPEFEIDGVPYGAERVFGRFGAVVRCYMLNPEDAEMKSIPEKTRKKMKLLHRMTGPAIAVLIVLFFGASRQFEPVSFLAAALIVIPAYVMLAFYKNMR